MFTYRSRGWPHILRHSLPISKESTDLRSRVYAVQIISLGGMRFQDKKRKKQRAVRKHFRTASCSTSGSRADCTGSPRECVQLAGRLALSALRMRGRCRTKEGCFEKLAVPRRGLTLLVLAGDGGRTTAVLQDLAEVEAGAELLELLNRSHSRWAV